MKCIKNIIILICLNALTSMACAKVLIITHAFNRPDFITLQHKTFKAFLQDDYEFVVFNDARDTATRDCVHTTCDELNIRCIDIPLEIHSGREDSKDGCADAVQYSLDNLGFDHDDIVFIIDSDMFLIKPFSITQFMQEKQCDLYGCYQQRGHVFYIWNGLVMMDMPNLPNKRTMNFAWGTVEGHLTDVGGYLHYYLKDNPTLRVTYYDNIHFDDLLGDKQTLRALLYDDAMIDLIIADRNDPYPMELHVEKHFLHYRAGGNWNYMPASYHANKSQMLNTFISAITQ